MKKQEYAEWKLHESLMGYSIYYTVIAQCENIH